MHHHILLATVGIGVSQAQVVSVTNLNDVIENYIGSAHALASDGTMVAFNTRIENGDERVRSLCIFVFAEATSTCVPFPDESLIWRADRMVWLPDNRKIAMTEDLFQNQDEPDIWVFDLDTQSFSNLSDDNASGSLQDANNASVDYFPIWHPVSGDLFSCDHKATRSG